MTEKKLHSVGSLVLAALVLGALSCQPARSPEPARPPAPRRGGTLHLWVPAADMLDPLFLDDVYEASVSVNLFNGLVALDDNLAVVPDFGGGMDGFPGRADLRPQAAAGSPVP